MVGSSVSTGSAEVLSSTSCRIIALTVAITAAILAVVLRVKEHGNAPQSLSSVPSLAEDSVEAKLTHLVSIDSLDVNSRWKLCERLESRYESAKDRGQLPRILSCYDALWSTIRKLQEQSADHPRRRWLEYQQQIAHIVGDRYIRYAEGQVDRFRMAAERLQDAVRDEGYCSSSEQTALLAVNSKKNTGSCARAYALLLLSLRASGAPGSRLEQVFFSSQGLPEPLQWQSPGRIHLQHPGCRAKPFWDVEAFPWIQELQKRAFDIQKEFRDLERITSFQSERGALVELLADVDAWTNIRLYQAGVWNETLCSALPSVCGVLRGLPDLDRKRYRRPLGFLEGESPPLGVNLYRLLPGRRITPHFGSNSRLVASMGIEVAFGAEATLRVGDMEVTWREGEALVFDDSFEHEVIHRGSRARTVLAVVFLHPDVLGQI